MEYVIRADAAGKTVLEVMKQDLGISSALLKHLKFTDGGILVCGHSVTVRYVLKEGEILSLATEDRVAHEKIMPVALPLSLAYEDEDVVVPDKPPNMPTHPSCGHYTDTVANALAYYYEERGIPFVFRPVNRLDRNTSGLLLIAKNRMAAGTLYRAMRQGKIRKLYLAVLAGEPEREAGLIETYMRRTATSVILRENCREGEGGDLARTYYRVFHRQSGYALVCAAPLTGRTHQLRVHFAGIGCPILGDDLYGSPSPWIERHALHSYFLSFPRVKDGMPTAIKTDIPSDLQRVLAQLGDVPLPSAEEIHTFLRELPASNDFTD